MSYSPARPPGGGFKTITVGGYVGSGASMTMNVALVGTGSSGQLGDEIVISGGKATATGQTSVSIVNTTTIAAGQSINKLIPLFVTANGGTISSSASFLLASAPNVSGYAFSLEQTSTGVDLVATQTTSQSQLGSSVNNVAASQQKALITSQVLTSILLGATEQVNCTNCGSGFGSIGSYALGAHGRTSLTPEVTLMGGFSYDEYSAPGMTVTNAPTFAASIVYDPTNFGQSRPFAEVGGGVIPFEQVHYTRIYPYAGESPWGTGTRSTAALACSPASVGWTGSRRTTRRRFTRISAEAGFSPAVTAKPPSAPIRSPRPCPPASRHLNVLASARSRPTVRQPVRGERQRGPRIRVRRRQHPAVGIRRL